MIRHPQTQTTSYNLSMLIKPILFKKEVTDNYGTRSFHYLNHRMSREPSVDKQLSTTFFVTIVIVIHQSPMACFLCCRFYSPCPLRENHIWYIRSIPLRGYVAREKYSHFRNVSYSKGVRNQNFFQNVDFFHSSSITVWNFCARKQLKK